MHTRIWICSLGSDESAEVSAYPPEAIRGAGLFATDLPEDAMDEEVTGEPELNDPTNAVGPSTGLPLGPL